MDFVDECYECGTSFRRSSFLSLNSPPPLEYAPEWTEEEVAAAISRSLQLESSENDLEENEERNTFEGYEVNEAEEVEEVEEVEKGLVEKPEFESKEDENWYDSSDFGIGRGCLRSSTIPVRPSLPGSLWRHTEEITEDEDIWY